MWLVQDVFVVDFCSLFAQVLSTFMWQVRSIVTAPKGVVCFSWLCSFPLTTVIRPFSSQAVITKIIFMSAFVICFFPSFPFFFFLPFSVWLLKYVWVFHGNVSIGIWTILLCLVLCALLYSVVLPWIVLFSFNEYALFIQCRKAKYKWMKRKTLEMGNTVPTVKWARHTPCALHRSLEERRVWAISAKATGWQVREVMEEPGSGKSEESDFPKLGMEWSYKKRWYSNEQGKQENSPLLTWYSKEHQKPAKCFQVVFWLKKFIHQRDLTNCSPFEVTKISISIKNVHLCMKPNISIPLNFCV